MLGSRYNPAIMKNNETKDQSAMPHRATSKDHLGFGGQLLTT
jgi:hypothetical protein